MAYEMFTVLLVDDNQVTLMLYEKFLAAHAAEIRDHGVLVTHSAPDDSYAPVMDAVDAVVGRKRSFERSVVSDLHVG